MTAPAKIVQLDIQNVMRIKAVHIKPDGNVVIVGGKNAQGKTAALDSICMALGGLKFCPDMPIREGEEKAEISLTLGDMSVTRKFWRGPRGDLKSSLSVKDAEGKTLSPPQQTLDAWIGPLSFDPLEFARMSPADQRETLRELVGLNVSMLEVELSRVYDSRTQAGQEKRAADAVVADLPAPGDEEEYLDLEGIVEEIRSASERRQDYEELKGVFDRRSAGLERLEEERLETIDRIATEQEKLARLEVKIQASTALETQEKLAIDDFDLPDLDEMQSRYQAGQERNNQSTQANLARENYQQKAADATAAAEHWSELDAEHGRIAQEIKDRTEAVEYPIPDLELRAGGVFYQGVPFGQGSLAERTKVSAVMGIAMNKGLGILLIRDGSVLDEDSMAMLAKIAGEHDMQFWIEMARGYEGVAGAIVIEDGSTQ